MQDYELTDWLGPADDSINPEQRERLHRVAVGAEVRYGPDRAEEQAAALAAAVQYLLGDTTLTAQGHELRRLRDAQLATMAALREVLLLAVQDGMSESQAARDSGLSRMTVRKMLGKGE